MCVLCIRFALFVSNNVKKTTTFLRANMLTCFVMNSKTLFLMTLPPNFKKFNLHCLINSQRFSHGITLTTRKFIDFYSHDILSILFATVFNLK